MKPVTGNAGTAGLIGYFDQLGESSLSGWAVDASHPGEPVRLDIRLDGQVLAQIKTSTARADVTATGRVGSVAGFSLSFPPGLFRPGAEIDVQFSGTSTSLRRSPRPVKVPLAKGVHAHFMDVLRQNLIRPVTIIVPIFNAYESVNRCLAAVMQYVDPTVRLLLIDDASNDPRIDALLQFHGRSPDVTVIRNPLNLGYTRSANLGLSHCRDRDVVLLNSDAIVTGHWLDSLRYCAYGFGKIATVTPLSNNAGVFSVPISGVENALPAGTSRDAYARAIVNAGSGLEIDVPTGNGFCMYMRRDAIENIGMFDELKFPRGYGEENEFCMRGSRKGWRHLVSDKAFVIHERSQSFGSERAELARRAADTIDFEFPEYRKLITRFSDLEFSVIRHKARVAVDKLQHERARRRLLFVISTQIGGTPQTNLDLMRSVEQEYECFLLRCDASAITLSRLVDGELQRVETYRLRYRIDPVRHSSDEYDNHVADLLYRYSIDLLHVRHIAWHSLGLLSAAKAMSVPVVYSVHDFYAVCPTVKLLDQESRFCGGRCTAGPGECKVELWKQGEIPNLKHNFIARWRENHMSSLEAVDAFVTTSDFAVDLFVTAFPAVSRGKFTVIPHGRDFADFATNKGFPCTGTRLKIVVLGNISTAKGANLIKAIADRDAGRFLEFHFLGNMAPELSEIGIHHGSYARDDVIQKIADIGPHVGIILSIWPETFCHTLTELWASGVPVLGMDIGAVGERIATSGAGWLTPPGASADEIMDLLQDIHSDQSAYAKRIEAVNRWQRGEGQSGSCAAMAERYVALYESLLSRPLWDGRERDSTADVSGTGQSVR